MDDKKERINVYMTPEVKEKAMRKANELSISMSALMLIALNQYLKEESVVDMVEMFKKTGILPPQA